MDRLTLVAMGAVIGGAGALDDVLGRPGAVDLALPGLVKYLELCRTFGSTIPFMQRIGIRELNQNTSQVLARVSGGESLEITDRGRPIARLVPVTDDQSVLARLVASGKASMPTGTGSVPLPPAWGDAEVDVADTIQAMRDEERW